MRIRTLGSIAAAICLIPLVLLVIGLEFLFGLSQYVYKPIRYRVAAVVEIEDRDQTVRSVANSDCWVMSPTRGILTNTAKSRRGEDNYAVLADRSVLVLPDLEPCRWYEQKPSPGASYVLDPLIPGYAKGEPGHVKVWANQAWRFDNIEEPNQLAIHDLPTLFRTEGSGLKVKGATTTVVERGAETAVTFHLEDRFPWLRSVPQANSFYDPLRPHGNFLGVGARVTQLVGGSRCPAPDPDAEGPVIIRDAPCTSVNQCTRGGENTYCGKVVGWLAGTTNADFSVVAFSIKQRSDGVVAVLHREPVLTRAGAPGGRSGSNLRWTPRICLDGSCAERETGYLPTHFYYPRANEFVTVRPFSFYAPGAFRRAAASY